MFHKMDSDNSGEISYDEFIKEAHDIKIKNLKLKVKFAFENFDLDDIEYIEINKFKELLLFSDQAVYPELVERIINCADTNVNGKIVFDEFIESVNKIISH